MITGPFVKIETQDHGSAFLVTWSKGEVVFHRAFGDLDRAQRFAEGFIGAPLVERTSFGVSMWEAQA